LWIALDCCERRRLSLNVFFGDIYGTESSQATNFAVNIRSTVTFWISIVRVQSWPSNWTAADITTVQAKFAITRDHNSWLAMESCVAILESPGSPRARQRVAGNLVRTRGATEKQSLTFILSLWQRERRV